MLNIIFGIIIDTFKFLRLENEKRRESDQNICFVCSLDRVKLEKSGKDFKQHVTQDHHMWNYLYYFYFLRKKDQTEYDGIESYVFECLRNESLEWMPINKALNVEGTGASEEELLEASID